jgi:signal transduction histidine kinase
VDWPALPAPVPFSPTQEARLSGALEHAVGAALAEAVSMTHVLTDQVDETKAPLVRAIHDAVLCAEEMLADLAAFLRADEEMCPEVARRRTNLSCLCDRVIDSTLRRYPTSGIKFQADRSVEVRVDPDAVAMMMMRLLLNAIQHGSTGAAVRLRVFGSDDRAFIEVWNAGAFASDVPPHRIFEPFACARPHPSGEGPALGLGLHLASRTARVHGGRIELESEARRGTTLRIALPRAPALTSLSI